MKNNNKLFDGSCEGFHTQRGSERLFGLVVNKRHPVTERDAGLAEGCERCRGDLNETYHNAEQS